MNYSKTTRRTLAIVATVATSAFALFLAGGAIAGDHGEYEATFNSDGELIRPGAHTQTCSCRKPEPGLFLRAARELQLDLSTSHMIGDTLRDVEAGHRAGCQSILIKTGHGQDELLLLGKADSSNSASSNPLQQPEYVAENILEAVNWILEQDFEGQSEPAH